jgi:hypothetical protein
VLCLPLTHAISVLNYDFDDGNGTITDRSGQGNTGSIYGDTKLLMHFDENIGVAGTYAYDETSYNNSGPLTGSPIWTESPSGSGSALQFNGSGQFLRIPSSNSNTLTSNSLSWGAWIKYNLTANNYKIFQKGVGSNYGPNVDFNASSGVVSCIIGRTGIPPTRRVLSASKLSPYRWYHFMCMQNTTRLNVFIDGSLNNTNTLTATPRDTAGSDLYIGRDGTGTETDFNGSIDEVVLYNRSLTAAEILAINNSGVGKMLEFGPAKVGYGNSSRFDGENTFINVSSSDSLNISGDISIEAWVNLTSNTTNQVLVQKQNSYSIEINSSGHVNGSFWFNNSLRTIQSTSQLSTGQWNHLALTFNQSVLKMYVDGLLETTSSFSVSTINKTGNSIYLGSSTGTSQFYNGLLDNVNIYNNTRTASEISQDFQNATVRVVNQSTTCTSGISYHTTITDALGNASQGDIIEVCQGTYNENLDINEQVDLRGFPRNASRVFINASNQSDNVIHIKNNSVNIGFVTILNTTISSGHGIFLDGTASANNINLSHVVIRNVSGSGIYSSNTNNTIIEHSIFHQKDGGGETILWIGINTTLNNNTFLGDCGTVFHILITVSGGSDNAIFSNNSILTTNNTFIFFITSNSDNAQIYNNFFNITTGKYFYDVIAVASADLNTSLINDTNIVNGSLRGGNYWGRQNGSGFSDTCQDLDHNGICDNNYTISALRGYIDYLPLTYPIPFIVESTNTPTGIKGTNTIPISANASNVFSGISRIWIELPGVNQSFGNTSNFTSNINFSGFKNSTGGTWYRIWANNTQGKINKSKNYTFSISEDISILVSDLNVSEFQLASSSYVDVHSDNITVSNTRRFGIINTMTVNKLGGGGSNLLTMRVLINGTQICEEDVRTLDTANEYGNLIGCMLDFTLTPGTRNITIQMKRSGLGTISVSNFKAILYEHQSNANFNISYSDLKTGNLTTFNTSFVSILNINVNKTASSKTLHFLRMTVESNGTETADFYLNDTLSGEVSPFVSREILDNTVKGSMFITWSSSTSELNHTLKLYARSQTGQLINVSNISIHNIDLIDSAGNTINATTITNDSTNLSRSRLIGASTTETLLQRNVKLVNGTSLWFSWSATLNSSQKTSPIIETYLVGEPQSTCFGQTRRTLRGSGSNGNFFDQVVCRNLTPGNTYVATWNVTTEPGKAVRILDEMVTVIEGVDLNISESNLAPLPNTITNPLNGTGINQTINATWRNFSDPNSDAVTYNVTLWNSSGFNRTIADNLNDNLTLFNITGCPDNTTYILRVEGCDPSGLCAHSNSSFAIDRVVPKIFFNISNTTYATTSLTLVLNLSDINPFNMWYSINNTANSSMFTPNTTTVLTITPGQNNITIYGNDSAGNYNQSSIIFFFVDPYAPAVTNIKLSPSSLTKVEEHTKVSVDVVENLTAIDTVILQTTWNGHVFNYTMALESGTTYVYSYQANESGTHSFRIFANDTIGNVNNSITSSISLVSSGGSSGYGGGGGGPTGIKARYEIVNITYSRNYIFIETFTTSRIVAELIISIDNEEIKIVKKEFEDKEIYTLPYNLEGRGWIDTTLKKHGSILDTHRVRYSIENQSWLEERIDRFRKDSPIPEPGLINKSITTVKNVTSNIIYTVKEGAVKVDSVLGIWRKTIGKIWPYLNIPLHKSLPPVNLGFLAIIPIGVVAYRNPKSSLLLTLGVLALLFIVFMLLTVPIPSHEINAGEEVSLSGRVMDIINWINTKKAAVSFTVLLSTFTISSFKGGFGKGTETTLTVSIGLLIIYLIGIGVTKIF